MNARSLSTARWWWFTLVVIVCVAGALRFTGYNFSLPYIDHPDEPNFYVAGQEWRGLYNDQNYLAGYPPLYIWLNIGVQLILEPLGIHGLAATVQVMRLIAVAISIVTLLLIALTARRAGGWFAGLMAGAAWAVAPLVVENGIYATPDPLVYLLVIAAVWFAVEALVQPGREHWCLWSVAAGCLAILTKYFVLSAVLPGLIAAVWIFRGNRRRGLRYLGIQGMLLVVTVAISAAGFSTAGRWSAVVPAARVEALANLFVPNRVVNNIFYAVYPINVTAFGAVCAVGIVAFLIARRQRRVRLNVVGLCAIILITVPWLAAAFSEVNPAARMKDVLPATTVACALFGIGLAQIANLLPRLGRTLLAAVVVVALFAPQISQDVRLTQARTRLDSRVALRYWADTNLTPGTVLVDAENHKTFNPYWGGIEGRHWFDWIVIDDLTTKSPEAWHNENGASYTVVDQSVANTTAGQAYLAPMLYLQDFDSDDMRGPRMQVYRLLPVQYEEDVTFGEAIRLIGYDLDTTTVASGDSLTLTFYWRATAPPQDNYSLFVHLSSKGETQLIAQSDGEPDRPERPTLTWTDGDETLISQPFTITVPADASPGDFELRIGLYNYQTGLRLPVVSATGDSSDFYVLTPITIR